MATIKLFFFGIFFLKLIAAFHHAKYVNNACKFSSRYLCRQPLYYTQNDNAGEDIDLESPENMVEKESNNILTKEIPTTEEPEKELPPVDPLEVATKAYEKELSQKLEEVESKLRAERQNLIRTKDRLSESGKSGFFIIQAQVADFQRKNEIQQKERVERNKRDFVLKMLPVVDSFRDAVKIAPATTERGNNMHKTFGSLLSSILILFQKYGYNEYTPAIGSIRDYRCNVVEEIEVDEGEGEEGKILDVVRPAMLDKEGAVLRRAQVVTERLRVLAELPPIPTEGESPEVEESVQQ